MSDLQLSKMVVDLLQKHKEMLETVLSVPSVPSVPIMEQIMESLPVSSERKTQFLESCRHKVETPSTPEPTSFGSGAPANEFWTPLIKKQNEGMAPWLAADPHSELAMGNEETPRERRQQHWDMWPQNEEFTQTHADEQNHQAWWPEPQLQEWAVDEWNVYHTWTHTNWPQVQQEVVEEEVVGEVVEEVAPGSGGPGAPPVQKRGRGERGGKHVKWWSGLHKARKNGPLSEAAYIQQNPKPIKKIKREVEEE